MVPSDLPTLTPLQYGRADALKREIAEMVSYAQCYPTSAAELQAWFAAANTAVAAAIPG